MELQKSSEWKASAQGRFKRFRAVQFKPIKYSEGGSNSLVHHIIFRARLVLRGTNFGSRGINGVNVSLRRKNWQIIIISGE